MKICERRVEGGALVVQPDALLASVIILLQMHMGYFSTFSKCKLLALPHFKQHGTTPYRS
jgi:hypothetical protein